MSDNVEQHFETDIHYYYYYYYYYYPQIDFVYLAYRFHAIRADQPLPTASITTLIILKVCKEKK